MKAQESICLSIVSHGQGDLIRSLLGDLQRLNAMDVERDEIILTLNVPEDESFLSAFPSLPIRILRNTYRKGFGANHNAAFLVARSDVFIVVNPDVRLSKFDSGYIKHKLSDSDIGLWAPRVLNGKGDVEDSVRRFPTVLRLARRVLLKQRGVDYSATREPTAVDWVAGMFMALRRETYAALGGFDERYFMYMEDADLCRRVWKIGMKVVFDPTVDVVHDARRASRKNVQHMRWHCRSAARFLLGI